MLCWEEGSHASFQSHLWIHCQWIILLLADALEILKTVSMIPALTYFRDPPSAVCQLQKVGLHQLNSLSGRHKKGIASQLTLPPALLTHFVALTCLRILLGCITMKEVIKESDICLYLSVSMNGGGNVFIFHS